MASWSFIFGFIWSVWKPMGGVTRVAARLHTAHVLVLHTHARSPCLPFLSPLLSYLQYFLAKPSMHHYKHAMFSVVSVEPLTTTPPFPSTNPNAWTTSPVSHLNRSLLTSPKGRGETKINKQYIIICVYYFSQITKDFAKLWLKQATFVSVNTEFVDAQLDLAVFFVYASQCHLIYQHSFSTRSIIILRSVSLRHIQLVVTWAFERRVGTGQDLTIVFP